MFSRQRDTSWPRELLFRSGERRRGTGARGVGEVEEGIFVFVCLVGGSGVVKVWGIWMFYFVRRWCESNESLVG